jgi:hypothetical protein
MAYQMVAFLAAGSKPPLALAYGSVEIQWGETATRDFVLKLSGSRQGNGAAAWPAAEMRAAEASSTGGAKAVAEVQTAAAEWPALRMGPVSAGDAVCLAVVTPAAKFSLGLLVTMYPALNPSLVDWTVDGSAIPGKNLETGATAEFSFMKVSYRGRTLPPGVHTFMIAFRERTANALVQGAISSATAPGGSVAVEACR